MAREVSTTTELGLAVDEAADLPANLRPIYTEIVGLTDAFCLDRLNDEYQLVCREMAFALCQPGSPVTRGKRASWASGVVYAVGRINFLSDPSSEPCVSPDAIAEAFGVSKGTMQSKSRALHKWLDLNPIDPEFTLPSLLGENPLVWMVEINGLIVDLRGLPREIQVEAYEAGVIPYVHADTVGGSAVGEGDAYQVTHQRLPSGGERPTPKCDAATQAFQIKVTLNDIEPKVWRRLLVADISLAELHEVVQVAMGWQDCHMHEFSAGKQRFVMADADDFDLSDEPARDESDVLLSDLVAEGRKKLDYWYDFGDGWRHTVKIEKSLQRKPGDRLFTCVAGERACPPEDIGGPWGYANFLDAMGDPKHEQHEDFKEWMGDSFDAEEFDIDDVNECLTV